MGKKNARAAHPSVFVKNETAAAWSARMRLSNSSGVSNRERSASHAGAEKNIAVRPSAPAVTSPVPWSDSAARSHVGLDFMCSRYGARMTPSTSLRTSSVTTPMTACQRRFSSRLPVVKYELRREFSNVISSDLAGRRRLSL